MDSLTREGERKPDPLRRILQRLVPVPAVAGGIVAVALSFALNLGRPHFGIALMIGGLLSYYVLRSRSQARSHLELPTYKQVARGFNRTLSLAAILTLLAPLFWLVASRNDFVFFVVVASGAGLLSVASLAATTTRRAAACLSVMLLASCDLALRQLSFTDGLVGVDPWFHAGLTSSLLVSGSISQVGIYGVFPGLHVLAASLALFGNLTVVGSFRLMVVLTPIAALAAFSFFRRLLPTNVALVGATFFTLSDHVLFWQIWFTPYTLGLLLLFVGLFLASASPTASFPKRAAIILVFAAIVVTHPFATLLAVLAFAMLLLGGTVASLFHEKRAMGIKAPSLLLFVCMTLAWWTYSVGSESADLLARMVYAITRVLQAYHLGEVNAVTIAGTRPYVFTLLNDSGIVAALSLFPAGVTIMLSDERTPVRTAIVALFGATFFTVFPLVLGAGGAAWLLPDRWFVIGYAFALPASALTIATVASGRRLNLRRGLCALVTATVVFSMISNPLGSAVQPLLRDPGIPTNWYTDAEIAAPDFVRRAGISMPIATDARYGSLLFRDSYKLPNAIVNLTPENAHELSNPTQGYLFVRESLKTSVVVVSLGPLLAAYEPLPSSFWFALQSGTSNRLYDNGEVSVYQG